MVGRVCTSRGRELVAAQVAQAEQLQLLLCIARGLAGSDVAGAGEHRDHLGAKAGIGGEYAVEPGESVSRTYTPSSARVWAWTLSLRALSNRCTKVTAPGCASSTLRRLSSCLACDL